MAENIGQHQIGRSAETPASKSKPVVNPADIPLYHEFGLGRGINVTNPNMWKNKTPYLVRKANYTNFENSNIVGTQEGGTLERYKKEVSTFEVQKQEVWLSLHDSISNKLMIGMDEQSSRSTSSTKLIEGEKIETCTISFKCHFDDLPLYDGFDQAVIFVPESFLHEDNENKFENDLAEWFLKRIEDREAKSYRTNLDVTDEENEKNAIEKLANKLDELAGPDGLENWYENTKNDCEAFIKYMGITHYVSAIKLGACRYHIVTSRSEQKTIAIGTRTSMVPGSLAKGGLSGILKKKFSFSVEEEQLIGMIDKVNNKVKTEAVIGFEIQPIYKLVRIQLIQVLLRIAIKNYIVSKDNIGK